MRFAPTTRYLLLAALVLGLVVIYLPLLLVLLNSFNADTTFGWPPSALTVEWWRRVASNEGAVTALWTSVRAGLAATAIALVLGTMAAFALQRYRRNACPVTPRAEAAYSRMVGVSPFHGEVSHQ